MEKNTKPFLKHFHFQKDANIASSSFLPLCVSGQFQVIVEQHFELKIHEREGDGVVSYTYFSFSLNKCYMLLLGSPVNILKSFLMKIFILIQWMRNFFSSLGTAWGSERFHSSSSDTDRLEGTVTQMRFKFLKAGVQELQTPHARPFPWCWQKKYWRSAPFWTCEESSSVPQNIGNGIFKMLYLSN